MDFFRVLVRNQSHRELGHGPGGYHGFGSFPGKPGKQAVHIQRRARPGPLVGGKPGFAIQAGNTCLFNVITFIGRQAGKFFVLFLTQRAHFVVETRQGNATVFIVHTGNQFGQCIGRVMYHTTKHTGV